MLQFIVFNNNYLLADWVQTAGPTGGPVSSITVSGTNLFAGTSGDGVYLSTNSGTSWTQVNNGLLNNSVVYALAVSGTNLFAGTAYSGVYLSENDGTNWTQVNNGLTDLNVRAFALNQANLFAGTENGDVCLSTNYGTSWTKVNNGHHSYTVTTMTFSGTKLFVGILSGGVYLSTNNWTSWTEVNIGLTNRDVKALAVSGTNLFAGTMGGSVWRRPISEFTLINDKPDQLPGAFELKQNYPNPFNPACTINYSLPKEGNVKLTVYNAIGNKVATILNEYKSAGNYSILFNGSNLASGIYLYRLESGNYSAAKKFILMK